MSSNDMRAMVKRICSFASRNFFKAGYDIDVEKSLYIRSTKNLWTMNIADERVKSIVDNENRFLLFGAEFTHYVPMIDRFEDVSEDILEKSPVGGEYMACRLTYGNFAPVILPLADEFAYKFPDIAVEMILHKLMSKEIYAYIENPEKMHCTKILYDENTRYYEDLKKLMRKSKSPIAKNKLSALMFEHNSAVASIEKMMAPIKIQMTPKACSSIEELEIMLDFYDV